MAATMMGTVRCAACGGENRDGAAFCRACGASLGRRVCPSCGGPQAADARFCDRCGADLGATTAPRRTLEEVIGAPAAERRLVTVLFADATSSTALTERIGDEEMYGVVQEYVTRMQRIVEAHDGTVVQFRGDGVMALFGAPVALEDAAVSAVVAALEIQASLQEYGASLAARAGVGCRFRLGVNTGPVVVGRVGDDTLVDYTAIGDTANVAARLEDAAGDGEVLVSDLTWRAVRDFVECEPVGALQLKGKSGPVQAYRAVRRRPIRTRLDAAQARGLSPFVGRDDELALLEGFVSRLTEGHGRVVALAGEAGVGKSRLLRQLREALPGGVDWLEGRSSAADRRAPWHLVVDLLRRTLTIGEQHGYDDIARIVDERASRWSQGARIAAPYLGWLLGAPVPEIARLDPQERRAGILEALVTAVCDAASRRPIIVALEDLHWADEASVAGIAAIANAVAGVPVLLVVTYRPEAAPELGDRPWFTRLALDGLAAEAAGELAAASVGTPLSDEARALVVGHAGGNPLFVEELAASLVEDGTLQVRNGVLELARAADAVDVPASLQDVVLARIGRLDEDARRALQLASVIGREFTRRILDRIAQMPERLDRHLADLEALELIRQRSWYPELAYLFKHAVVHDVTYSTLLEERRRQLHRVVALATEELYAGTLGEHCESLARHWLSAGEDERALPYLVEAADRALAGFSMPRAIEAYDHAAEVAQRRGRPELVVELRTRRLDALFLTSDLHAAVAEADRVASLAAELGDVAAQAYAFASRAFAENFLRDLEAALEHAATAERLGRQALAAGCPPDGFALALVVRGLVHASRGHFAEYDAIQRELEPVFATAVPPALATWPVQANLRANWRAEWHPDPPWIPQFGEARLAIRVWLMWTAALHAAGLGAYDRALAWLGETLALCERTGELLARARVLNTIGWVHGDLGDVAGATAYNERSIATVPPSGLPDREIEANARLNLADDALMEGRLDDAEAELSELERTVRRPRPSEQWMLWRYSQRWLCTSGELAQARGDARAALALADECLPRAEDTDSRKYVVRARRLRGRALAALGRGVEAGADLHAALALARELGNPPQLWRTLIAAAEVAEDGGRRRAAEALDVIDGVVADLADDRLRTALQSGPERARAAELAAAGL